MNDTKTNLCIVILTIVAVSLYLIAFFNMIGVDIHDVIQAIKKL